MNLKIMCVFLGESGEKNMPDKNKKFCPFLFTGTHNECIEERCMMWRPFPSYNASGWRDGEEEDCALARSGVAQLAFS